MKRLTLRGKNKRNRVVIAQKPNWQITLAFSLYLLSLFETGIKTELRTLSALGLLIWAYEELVHGVNVFRRLLGLAVLAITTWRLLARV